MIDFAKLSFCESATASSLALWHLRELSQSGKKRTGGGIDTASFCGRVRPTGTDPSTKRIGFGGWDLEMPVTLESCEVLVKLARDRPGRLCPSCYGTLLHKLGLEP